MLAPRRYAEISRASTTPTRQGRGILWGMVLAIEFVDLGAFVGMGLSVLVVGALVLGLGLWLRRRPGGNPPGLYRGL